MRARSWTHSGRSCAESVCGISGSLAGEGTADAAVGEQLRLLRHRGPDATGWFAEGTGVIGQNRLAIIDLETGDPPITNEDGTIGVVLNGEIYNYRELRRELETNGHRLRSRGDTEVVAHLAEDLDAVDVARALDGMFAFAVWDARRRRLTLARDRFGKKPLYYAATPRAFVFGSEIKAVLAHPDVPKDLDEGALPAYVTFGYVPTPRTFYRGVFSLPPGHVLTVEPGSEPVIAQYWRLETGRSAAGLGAVASNTRKVLERAVAKRLVSDVPLGAFLSGGIDSSAIVALMARMMDRPVQTFTIGFEDRDGFDERQYARAVADRYRTDHHEFVVAPNAVDLIDRLVWHHDQPFGDSSALPTFLLNELTKQHVTVALSGDGGDEAFAGYERFAAALAIERLRRVPAPLRSSARQAIDRLPRHALNGRVASVQRFIQAANDPLPWSYLTWLSYFTDDTRREALPGSSDWATTDFADRWEASSGWPTLDRVLDLNLHTYLVDDLLVKADRMSMAHALEVRSPFLDTDLVEYARSLPPELKLRGFSRKRVLKEAVKDLLPKEIVARRKRGFGVPLDRWFRSDLKAYLESTVGSRRARLREHLRPDVVDRVLHEHASGARDNGQALWMLLTLELFLRREGW